MYTGLIKVNLFTRVHVNMNFIKKLGNRSLIAIG